MADPDIILLNGCSSAGKTSIALALQAQLPRLWMHLGVDHFLNMAPRKYHGAPEGVRLVPLEDGTLPVRLGPVGYAILESFHRAVHAIAASGVPVIVDDVIFEARLMHDWRSMLAGLDVFSVGVYCALEELERREIARGDRGRGQGRSQIDVVHTDGAYDLTVDTTSTSADACAAAIVVALSDRRSASPPSASPSP